MKSKELKYEESVQPLTSKGVSCPTGGVMVRVNTDNHSVLKGHITRPKLTAQLRVNLQHDLLYDTPHSARGDLCEMGAIYQ